MADRPRVLTMPAADARATTAIGHYLDWLDAERGLRLDTYEQLWQWSVTDLDAFWQSLFDHFGVVSDTRTGPALADASMPGARWFPDARVNYARHLLVDAHAGHENDHEVAVIAFSQTRERLVLTFGDLREQVARARAGLVRLGVRSGDRVAAYLPNIPETLVAFLATASLGAVWASCAPEFGPRSVVDRFSQIEPTVLLAVAGYTYGDKAVDRREEVAAIRAELPTLRHVVHVPYGEHPLDDSVAWDDLLREQGPLDFEPVPFAHPLCVLFSSGTTGKPKAITHGHGGLTLEHLKNQGFCWDLQRGDRFMWFSTTAWMMWNALVSGLLLGSAIVMIDGNPLFPDLEWQWRVAEESGATVMGVSPGFVMACRKEGVRPAATHDLSRIKQVAVAGSPLTVEGFEWLNEQFGDGVILNVASGGTDICSGMVGGNPLLPVYAGEMSGRLLGVDTRAFDPEGREVVGELGELVITTPLPSMPLGFWGDDDGSRYREAYFDMYPGVWRQGDWIRFTPEGTCVITGRSDATLNRGGVRLGTSEFYAVVEEFPEVVDSLVVHLEDPEGGPGELLLYVVLREGVEGTEGADTIGARVRAALKGGLSPRHIPDEVVVVPSVPRSRTGKKLELPVKRILQGRDPDTVASRDALVDATSLDAYIEHAARRASS